MRSNFDKKTEFISENDFNILRQLTIDLINIKKIFKFYYSWLK